MLRSPIISPSKGVLTLVVETPVEERNPSASPRRAREHATLISPQSVSLHQRSPSKFGIQEVMSLDEKIFQGNLRLSQMRRGEPLSKLLNLEEEHKTKNLQNDGTSSYSEALSNATSDDQLLPSTQPSSASSLSSIRDEPNNFASSDVHLGIPPSADDVMSGGSSLSPLLAVSSTQRIAAEPESKDASADPGQEIANAMGIPGMEGDPAGEALARLRARRRERKKNSKYFGKTVLQQQPVFYDPMVNQWHRRLSIIIWMMETMKTVEPYLRRPFTTCWQLCQPEIDPAEAKKRYEKTMADLALWDDIEATAKADVQELQDGSVDHKKLKRQRSLKFKTVAKLTGFRFMSSPLNSEGKNTFTSEFEEGMEDEEDSNPTTQEAKSQPKKGKKSVRIKKASKKSKSKDNSPKPGIPAQTLKSKTNKSTTIEKQPPLLSSGHHSTGILTTSKDSNKSAVQALKWKNTKVNEEKLPPIVKSAQPRNSQNERIPKFKPKRWSSGTQKPMESRWDFPQQVLDPYQVKEHFHQIRSQNENIVRQQLLAIERDARAGIRQRFSSLEVKTNFHSDLHQMRQGVVIESAEIARRRLMVNFEWFEELRKKLPPEALENVYINNILKRMEPMCEYICQNTDKMCSKRLLAALGTLRRWEIDHYDVEFAIKYIINNIIYFSELRYEHWLQRHYEYLRTRKIDDIEALSVDGHRLPIY